jgi:Flp pilus assembly pilin Flp
MELSFTIILSFTAEEVDATIIKTAVVIVTITVIVIGVVS